MKQSTKEDGSKQNFNSIYQAAQNSFVNFNGGQSDLTLFGAYHEASGSCFVTLSSKHFLKIGGFSNTKILGSGFKNVKLFSYKNRQLFEHGHSRGRDTSQAHQVRL